MPGDASYVYDNVQICDTRRVLDIDGSKGPNANDTTCIIEWNLQRQRSPTAHRNIYVNAYTNRNCNAYACI